MIVKLIVVLNFDFFRIIVDPESYRIYKERRGRLDVSTAAQ